MNILFIGTDRQIFIEGTEARSRIQSYAVLADVVHVIVFAKRSLGFSTTQLAPNVFVYPTNSLSKCNYVFDAIRIGKTIKNISLISSQDPFECALPALSLTRFHKAKLQIQMHIDAFGTYFKKESLLNPLRSRIARFTLPRADCIRPVSERIKVSVLAQGLHLRTEPVVLPVYVNVSRFETEEPKESLRVKYPLFHPLVLMAGRLVPQKDIPTALRAFAQFLVSEPKARLVLVGEGQSKGMLQRQVQELGIEKSVVFAPWQKDMLSFLKTADIFLMTSTHEGYQRALGEAAASGVPVVTTDTGPVGSLYKDGETVLVCPVGDDKCIAEKLIQLAQNDTLRERLITQARIFAHTAIAPDYDTYLKEYRALLESCLHS